MTSPDERKSFWERHEFKFYRYGHVYALIYGQVVIDYVPQRALKRGVKVLLIAYGHLFSMLLIVVLPGYFCYHFRTLTDTLDRRLQLLFYVSFTNTAIKYATVIVTYVANTVHFEAINQRCTMQRTHLEFEFKNAPQEPKRPFEFFMYFKFCLINLMMMIQVCGIFAQYGEVGKGSVSQVRVHFAIYAFVLWNYTENMADYCYFINGSVLKYYRQFNLQLGSLRDEMDGLRPGGMLLHHCCELSDRLEELRRRCREIHDLQRESFRMHQFQLIGLMLSTLINNLTNFYTLFHMLAKQSLEEVSYPVVVGSVYATGFYIDTYIVALINEHIKLELEAVALTMRRFAEPREMDERLTREIEHLSLELLNYQPPMLCGLLHLDRRLVYLIAVTAFSYFITLVQFDLYLRKKS
uniref:Gustatory receptor 10a n=4 Tax=Drosophila melanogaster TaxID=7227 RepID=GR10A_DROME|nr:gustatory receptor 10a [Drosophila melanogaster]P58950.1 RecName: Full=Gustatory receptor 10a [Drosophila melanogaster]AAN09631.1 gustatory receptor 10a [Drosophila melanogaster]ABK97611.1 gustatory receptor 10a [Drosophila melanogaster]|eukprot:NP_727523.1 gustatory receptor 10a [Drosophila melanogaster]